LGLTDFGPANTPAEGFATLNMISLRRKKIDLIIGVRGLAKALVEGASAGGTKARYVETPEEAGELLAKELRPGDAALLKASRGVKLEKALEKLRVLRSAMTEKK